MHLRSLRALIFLSLSMLAACGARSTQPADELVDAGMPLPPIKESGSGVTIPDPPNDGCDAFGLEFSASCQGCSTITCPCTEGLMVFPPECFSPFQRGCVSKVDCAAFCGAPGLVYDCVFGLRCRKPSDCRTGSCVAVKEDGTRQCVAGMVGDPCNQNDQCTTSRCALPDGGFWGRCTGGQERDPCFRASDCDPKMICIGDGGLAGGKVCSKGLDGSICTTAMDCLDGRKCVLNVEDMSKPRTCSSGATGSNCGFNDDCASGICFVGTCSDGMKGAKCNYGTQCVSKFCTAGTCGDGALGDPCKSNDSCQTGKCSGNSDFVGVCTDGADGHTCGAHEQCDSGHCTGGTNGVCTRRRLGDRCANAQDCVEGTCPTTTGRDPLASACPPHPLTLTPFVCANNGYCIECGDSPGCAHACYHFRCVGGTADAGAD